ncbi:hypothetical protein X474_09105 [Dethiosulfatarculus sandiegensis]|uniref:Uncharacterized protein n=1 Tax=Dethiosulfatarculus sandiegensis TaxID=1429043 RepID=A0A0D2JXS0_9BACT|nr:hypothetical protein X474_09105 [Dethiosulfatarculus sandiegensis]
MQKEIPGFDLVGEPFDFLEFSIPATGGKASFVYKESTLKRKKPGLSGPGLAVL